MREMRGWAVRNIDTGWRRIVEIIACEGVTQGEIKKTVNKRRDKDKVTEWTWCLKDRHWRCRKAFLTPLQSMPAFVPQWQLHQRGGHAGDGDVSPFHGRHHTHRYVRRGVCTVRLNSPNGFGLSVNTVTKCALSSHRRCLCSLALRPQTLACTPKPATHTHTHFGGAASVWSWWVAWGDALWR